MPVHTGHAPYGELNENDRGSRSSIASGWPLGQARFSEKPRIALRVVLRQVDELQLDQAVGQAQRGLDRVGQPLLGRSP